MIPGKIKMKYNDDKIRMIDTSTTVSDWLASHRMAGKCTYLGRAFHIEWYVEGKELLYRQFTVNIRWIVNIKEFRMTISCDEENSMCNVLIHTNIAA